MNLMRTKKKTNATITVKSVEVRELLGLSAKAAKENPALVLSLALRVLR
jgi:hypothetical protein